MKLSVALADCLRAGQAAILVTVEDAQGSTPRDRGTNMLVLATSAKGTIGGGALEMEAILEARRLLTCGESRSQRDIALGPAIGQCCGGRVVLSFCRADAAVLEALSAAEEELEQDFAPVFIFGAGHTGHALAAALAALPFKTTVVDTRPALLEGLPANVLGVASALPEVEVRNAPPATSFVVVTHDHALDFHIAAAALARPDSPYVGMIGSATKRERFRRYLRDMNAEAGFERLILPIGGAKLRDKRPEVIAALTAAELLVEVIGTHGEKRMHRLCTCP
ncbi:xanthine dehydrogenase accessory protein XdhC [Aureimonas fodinaquatilis]|uniref:Xanthine dehydrogenase accessory protein XdhC n=1 Tax=Aureimonas fodinaquatilis TaxID=2565783 RepID=A0A5B0DRK4_9HYPH|nr:xanthine dehydrogenase accessory protein XdhC [Aureimonas fodinaquatilis]KAA0968632.1 xanthine dehydrogenase accessory protein XdhC [Aureimonas fodinaquatilis]